MDERVIEILQVLTRAFIDLGAEELQPRIESIAEQDATVFRMKRG